MRSLSLYETIPQNMDEKVLEKLNILFHLITHLLYDLFSCFHILSF